MGAQSERPQGPRPNWKQIPKDSFEGHFSFIYLRNIEGYNNLINGMKKLFPGRQSAGH